MKLYSRVTLVLSTALMLCVSTLTWVGSASAETTVGLGVDVWGNDIYAFNSDDAGREEYRVTNDEKEVKVTAFGVGKIKAGKGCNDVAPGEVTCQFAVIKTLPVWTRQMVIYGSSFDDNIELNTQLNDSIWAVRVHGNLGNDSINAGQVSLDGSTKSQASTARILLEGNDGNDTITAPANPHPNPNRKIYTSLVGGYDDDTLVGGPGQDDFIAESVADGNDTISNVNEYDSANYGNRTDPVVVKANGLRTSGDPTAAEKDLIPSNMSYITGGKGDDVLAFSPGFVPSSEYRGIYGNEGNDTISGSDNNDELDGAEGDDTVYGYGGKDTLVGDQGSDTLIGGGEEDILNGGEGKDRLQGDDGNDLLIPILPRITKKVVDGDDTFSGGKGVDTLSLVRRIGTHSQSIYKIGDSVSITLNDVADDAVGDGVDNVESDIENIVAGDENDTIVGSASANTIDAGDGDDVVDGAGGDDSLDGGAGVDKLDGGAGADVLSGREGDDSLDGQAGDDHLNGDVGDDNLMGNDGIDQLRGGAGDDELFGGVGNDLLIGGAGVDVLSGREGNDLLDGQAGDDQLDGGVGDDNLMGNDGIDTLRGGIGDDELFGGMGADVLMGSEGDDALNGGDNDDRLVGGVGSDVLSGGVGSDTVDYADSQGAVHVTVDGVADDGVLGEQDNVYEDNEVVVGSAFDDVLVGGNANNGLFGGEGDDKLDGGKGSDRLDGGDDNDSVAARDGVIDVVLCGAGSDTATVDDVDDVGGGDCETIDPLKQKGNPPVPVPSSPTGSSGDKAPAGQQDLVQPTVPVGGKASTLRLAFVKPVWKVVPTKRKKTADIRFTASQTAKVRVAILKAVKGKTKKGGVKTKIKLVGVQSLAIDAKPGVNIATLTMTGLKPGITYVLQLTELGVQKPASATAKLKLANTKQHSR